MPHTPWAEIAVSGRSNVGKSSLLNTLLGRKNFARVSKEPGKTRTINFYLINDRFYFVDLPGYGYARVSAETRRRWKRAIFEYIDGREALEGIIQLVDSRHPPSKDDLNMLQRFVDSGRPFLVVFTKADKIGRSERSRVLEIFRAYFDGIPVGLYSPGGGRKDSSVSMDPRSGGVPVIFFSAKTGEGKDELWSWVIEMIS